MAPKPPPPPSTHSFWLSSLVGASTVLIVSFVIQMRGHLPVTASPSGGYPSAPIMETEPPRVDSTLQEQKAQAHPNSKEFADKAFKETCSDKNPSCEAWARVGECFKNSRYMRDRCAASCHICASSKPAPKKPSACEDTNANCATWASIGECDSNPGYMLTQCPVTCRMCQSSSCFDARDDCAERCRGGVESNFSASVRCYSEPSLLSECKWTCGACDEHRFSRPACKRDSEAKPAALPGTVDKIFSSIAQREDATVRSREPWVRPPTSLPHHPAAPRRGRVGAEARLVVRLSHSTPSSPTRSRTPSSLQAPTMAPAGPARRLATECRRSPPMASPSLSLHHRRIPSLQRSRHSPIKPLHHVILAPLLFRRLTLASFSDP
ncbi:MAG: hypothetical protein SGPRY_005556 [Prymnesium sp.]